MRTTVTFSDDVASALKKLQRERSVGLSAAVNDLIRVGLTAKQPDRKFRQRTQPLALKIDVSNVAEAIEALEGPSAR